MMTIHKNNLREARSSVILFKALVLAGLTVFAACKSSMPPPLASQPGTARELFRASTLPAEEAPAPAARRPVKSGDVSAEPTSWPVSLAGEEATFVIHEPVVEQLDDGVMKARALVLARSAAAPQPVVGSVMLRAIAEMDAAKRWVALVDVQVLEASFPVSPERVQAWKEFLRAALPDAARTMALAQFETNRTAMQARQRARESIAPPAPRIIV